MRIVGQWLDNATEERPRDYVGVATAWTPPTVDELCSDEQFEEIAGELAGKDYRADSRAKEWCGDVIARVLGLDAKEQKGTINQLLKKWFDNGRLAETGT